MHVNDPKSRTPAAAPPLSQVTERARETNGDALRPLAYGISDAAKVSGLSRSTLYELIKSGALHSVKIAVRRLVTRTALLDLLNAGAE